jgi:hypothetical protein
MPVISALWEAETEKVAVLGSLGKKFARLHLNRKSRVW